MCRRVAGPCEKQCLHHAPLELHSNPKGPSEHATDSHWSRESGIRPQSKKDPGCPFLLSFPGPYSAIHHHASGLPYPTNTVTIPIDSLTDLTHPVPNVPGTTPYTQWMLVTLYALATPSQRPYTTTHCPQPSTRQLHPR